MPKGFFTLAVLALTVTAVGGLTVAGGVAVAQTASGKYPMPERKSYNPPIPDLSFRQARQLYYGRMVTRAKPAEAREEVRIFVLYRSAARVRKNRAYAVANGWEPEFIEVLDEMVAWVEDLRRGDPRRPYELAKRYEADTKIRIAKYIASALKRLAVDMGHPEAMFERALKEMDKKESFERHYGEDLLRALGDRNYRPALKELIDRHLEARGFRRDPGVAYYWLRRGDAVGMDVAAKIAALEQTLSAADRKRAEDWLASGEYPQSWDY